MNRKLLWIMAVLSLMSLLLLASCKDGGQTDETGTDTGSGTAAETEAVVTEEVYSMEAAAEAPMEEAEPEAPKAGEVVSLDKFRK